MLLLWDLIEFVFGPQKRQATMATWIRKLICPPPDIDSCVLVKELV